MSYKSLLTKQFYIAVMALILNAISFTGFSQNIGYDIYSAGYYESGEINGAAIYKNDKILYADENTLPTKAELLAISPDGEIYWIMYTRDGNQYTYYLKKGDITIKEIDRSVHVSSMYFAGDTLFFSGYRRNENGTMDAMVWIGEDINEFLTLGDGIYNSDISKSIKNGNDIYHCGRINVEEYCFKGAVWKNDELLFICDETSTYFDDITIDGDDIYTKGGVIKGHESHYCIWKNNIPVINSGADIPMFGMTAKDGDVYYITLSESSWTLYKNDDYYCYWPSSDLRCISKIMIYEGEPWFCGGAVNGIIWKGSCDETLQPERCGYINDFQIVTKEYPKLGMEWYYEIKDDAGNVTYQYLQCSGDTTVSQKDVKIILRTNTLYDKGQHQSVTHEYVYGEAGVVYWWNKDQEEFTTLYDFNAQVGDEWEIKVGLQNITMHVDEVTTCEYNGEIMKMLVVSDKDDCFSGNIICNVGHTTSYFPEKLINRGDSEYSVDGLRCYWIDGDLMFADGNTECDKIYSVEENAPGNSTSFIIYPNPANGKVVLETVSGTTFSIINIMGQTVMSGVMENGNNNIDVSDLDDGIYFITAGNETQKLVIGK